MSISVKASGAEPDSNCTCCTDSLLQRSHMAAAMLPTGLKCAQAADLPSMEMGQPAMAFSTGPSYAQSLDGPTAPRSNATSERARGLARTTAASVSGNSFWWASCRAVLPKPQAVSPPATTDLA